MGVLAEGGFPATVCCELSDCAVEALTEFSGKVGAPTRHLLYKCCASQQFYCLANTAKVFTYSVTALMKLYEQNVLVIINV